MLHAFGVTDKGRVRATNEDCFGIAPDLQLCVVADGMGGHNAGEVASKLVVDSVLGYFRAGRNGEWPYGYDASLSEGANHLKTAVQVANARVVDVARQSPEWHGMGTTVVAMIVWGRVLAIAHVGDSRAYALAPSGAEQLTVDDSWTTSMLARDPSLDPALLRSHPMRNALTSVVGSKAQVDVHVSERLLAPGDLFLLTSDGVHGVLSEEELAQVCDGTDLADIAARLVRDALDHGSRDNCTALIARYEAD
ncbi:MAG: protein phosphatase 2C domain-containing protein [Vicinamibacterales bacterium]